MGMRGAFVLEKGAWAFADLLCRVYAVLEAVGLQEVRKEGGDLLGDNDNFRVGGMSRKMQGLFFSDREGG